MSADPDALVRQLQAAVLAPLAAVAARLDSVMALATDPQVQRRVGEAAEDLERVAAALRSQLRDLQRSGEDGVIASLREIVLDAGQRIGCAPRFDADPDVVDLAADLLADVETVLREALDNVVRHAYAGSLEVTIAAGSDLVVTVRDDGVGPHDEPPEGGGLARLAALAAARGGTSEIVANSDGFGSTLLWRVPLG